MHIHVKLGSTNPDGIDVEQVKKELPLGTVDVECVPEVCSAKDFMSMNSVKAIKLQW